MKLGMPTILEFNNIQENINLAKKLGYDFIELNLNLPYVRADLENKVKLDNTLKYTLHFFDEADFASYKPVVKGYLKLLKKYLRLTKNKIEGINIHLNTGPIITISGTKNYLYEQSYEGFITSLQASLKKVKKICDKYNIYLVIENIKCPPFILRTFETLKKDYHFCYDIGHDATDEFRLFDFVKNNLSSYKECHLHDFTATKDHLALGKVNIDLVQYFNQFDKQMIVLEVKSSEDLKESIEVIKNNDF